MMDDLISRQAAIEALEQIRYALWEIDIPSPTVPEYIEHHRDVQNVMKRIDEIRDKMERLPSAQPERKTGNWIIKENPGTEWYRVTCSACGEDVSSVIPTIGFFPNVKALWDFCPECGARMEEQE